MTASAIRASETTPQPHSAPGGRGAKQGGSGFLEAYDKAARGGTSAAPAAASDGETAATPDLPEQASSDKAPPKDKDATGHSDDSKGASPDEASKTTETEKAIAAEATQTTDAASTEASQADAKPASDAADGASDAQKETHHGKGSKATADTGDDDAHSKDTGKDGDASSVIAAIVVTPMAVLPVAQAGDDGAGKAGRNANAAKTAPTEAAAAQSAGPVVLDVGEVTAAPASGTRSALLSFNARLAALQSGAPQADGHAPAAAQPATAEADDAGSGNSDKGKTGQGHQGSDAAAGSRDLALMMGLSGDRGALSPRNADVLAGRIASAAASNASAAASIAQNTDDSAPGVVNSLKIELHPADLGSVTATLRATGNSLAINLTVTTDAAYQSLSADNGALVDKLKGHGYVVAQVTVQHVGATSTVQQAGGQQPGASTTQDNGARFGAQGQQSSFGQGRQSGSGSGGGGAFSATPDLAAGDDAGGADGLYL